VGQGFVLRLPTGIGEHAVYSAEMPAPADVDAPRVLSPLRRQRFSAVGTLRAVVVSKYVS
jgi:hypothetical protein